MASGTCITIFFISYCALAADFRPLLNFMIGISTHRFSLSAVQFSCTCMAEENYIFSCTLSAGFRPLRLRNRNSAHIVLHCLRCNPLTVIFGITAVPIFSCNLYVVALRLVDPTTAYRIYVAEPCFHYSDVIALVLLSLRQSNTSISVPPCDRLLQSEVSGFSTLRKSLVNVHLSPYCRMPHSINYSESKKL